MNTTAGLLVYEKVRGGCFVFCFAETEFRPFPKGKTQGDRRLQSFFLLSLPTEEGGLRRGGGGPVPNPPGFGCKRGISGAVQAVCTQKRFQTPRFQLTPGGAGPGARAGMAEAAISVDAEIIALGLKESRLKSLPKLQLKKKVAVPVYTSAK